MCFQDSFFFIKYIQIGLEGAVNLYSYISNPNNWVDILGLTPLIPDAPTYSGIYHIVGANGDTYVGSAVNIRDRLDTNSHPTASDIISKGDYTITFHEVDLGDAKTRTEIDHVLRHHEQQIMNDNNYKPLENGNRNKNNPEAKKKNARNKAEVEQHKAGFTGEAETKKYKGGTLCG